MYKRNETTKVNVGGIEIGNSNEIIIQTMTTVKTEKVDEVINQINTLATAGSKIVRLAILDMNDAKAIKEIKQRVTVPLVADIHFDYRLALEVIRNGIDKVRINPGNIGSDEKVKAGTRATKRKRSIS